MDFLRKYTPKNLSSIIGNEEQIETIIKWLSEFEQNKEHKLNKKSKTKQKKQIFKTHGCLLVIGEHGIGKTCCITTLLNEKQYDVKKIDITNDKNIKTNFFKTVNTSNVLDKLLEREEKKHIILIDNFETITSQIDKKFIISIVKYNEKYRICPIILISHNEHNKFIATVKQNCVVVSFQQPEHNQLFEMLIRICESENIKIQNIEVANRIVAKSQKDYRKLIIFLQDISIYLNQKSLPKITHQIVDEYYKTLKDKNTVNNIYKITEILLSQPISISECMNMYMSEKVFLPLMIHQNYIDYLTLDDMQLRKKKQDTINTKDTITISKIKIEQKRNKRLRKLKQLPQVSHNIFNKNELALLSSLQKISQIITKGDIIESYIYGDQNWDMRDVHGFYSCIYPSHLINKTKRKQESLHILFNFPKDLNKTSTKKINKKKVINSNLYFKSFSIDDFIHAGNLLKKIISNEFLTCDVSKMFSDLLKNYNITFDNLESILKINQIDKFTIPPNIKKTLTQI